jgi:hypothetical protein
MQLEIDKLKKQLRDQKVPQANSSHETGSGVSQRRPNRAAPPPPVKAAVEPPANVWIRDEEDARMRDESKGAPPEMLSSSAGAGATAAEKRRPSWAIGNKVQVCLDSGGRVVFKDKIGQQHR